MSVPEEMPMGAKPAEDKKKKWVIGTVCLVAVAASLFALSREIPKPLAVSTMAQHGMGGGAPGGGAPGGGPGGQRAPGTRGQITAIDAAAITIQGRDGVAKTFALTATTKITVDQKPAAAADLKTGQRARIVSKDGKSADEVVIRTRPPGGPGGYPGGGAPATASRPS